MRRIAVITAAAAIATTFVLPAQRAGGEEPDAWTQLAKSYDQNGDGKITTKEYPRGEKAFGNLDRNGDGTITQADFRSNRGGGRGQRRTRDMTRMIAMRLVRGADADRSGSVSAKEWSAFVEGLESANGTVSDEAIAELMPARRGRGGGQGGSRSMTAMLVQTLDKDNDGEVQVTEIAALFETLDADKNKTVEGAELGQRTRRGAGQRGGGNRGRGNSGGRKLPQVGEVAPDFELPYADDKEKMVKLSSFAGTKPVALIFGSYT